MGLYKPYCTLLDVQVETKNSGEELTSIYEECINRASRFIEDHCKRDFWFHDFTESAYTVPRGLVLGNEVILPFPILSITELRHMADATETSSSDFALDELDYYFETGKASISISSTEPINYPFDGKMELYGTFGYTLSEDLELAPPLDIPAGVRRACTIIAASWSAERRLEQMALDGSRVSIADSSIGKEPIALLERFVFRVRNNF